MLRDCVERCWLDVSFDVRLFRVNVEDERLTLTLDASCLRCLLLTLTLDANMFRDDR